MIQLDPMNFYELVLYVVSEEFLIVLGVIGSLGYLWRGRHAFLIPVSPWIYNIKAMVWGIIFIPFYAIINLYDIPLLQARAMSRILFVAILLSIITSHVNIYRKYRRKQKNLI